MIRLLRRSIARQLEDRAENLIKAKQLKIVAVTGSVGKTSTKLAIAAVLRQKFGDQVLVHEGNYNTEIGLPLSIFNLEVPGQLYNPLSWLNILAQVRRRVRNYPYKILVLELGVDHPGEMDIYLRYLKPDIGVITAIAPVHLEGFKSIEAIEEEKWKLALASRAVVYNADDVRLKRLAKGLAVPMISYGEAGEIYFGERQSGNSGPIGTLDLHLGIDTVIPVQTHVIGQHSLRALEAAAAVGRKLDLTPTQIKTGIENYHPVKGRMNPLKGLNGSLIIDDSYNASPGAAMEALVSLAAFPGRHIVVLGSMNELGAQAEELHRSVGERVARLATDGDLDLLVTIGQPARWIADEAKKLGMDEQKISEFKSPYEAGRFLAPLLKKGDVVLVKGSQNGVFAEEATKLILADPADANQLVRQSPHWLKIKRRQFGVQ